jgi:uncharacterized protein
MSQEELPKIVFPCAYPVKVMGLDVENYRQEVLDIIKIHAPDLCDEDISYRPSRYHKYLAVNVIINATGTEQLQALFDDLKASGRVLMVL